MTGFALKDRHRCPACRARLEFVGDAYICTGHGEMRGEGGHEWDVETIDTGRKEDGLAPGDRVYRWWDAGIHMDNQLLTVVRVNRTTVTVDTDEGSRFRMPVDEIAGFYTEADE